MLVWWLSEQEQAAIGDENALPEALPVYIRDEYTSMLGRPRRGRLWASPNRFGGGTVSIPWHDSPIARWCEQCGGIVIDDYDARYLAELPGLVTDMRLQRFTACQTPTERYSQ